MEDARYSTLKKPYIGIYKVISVWIFSLVLSDLFLLFLSLTAKLNGWVFKDIYYSIYNQLQFSLYILSPIIYFVCMKKWNLRYREKSFLKTWSFIPVIIALIKLYPLVMKHINSTFLLISYDSLSLHWICFTIGIILLWLYRNKSIYIIAIGINTILIIFSLYLTIYIHNHIFLEMQSINLLNHILMFINQYHLYMLSLPLFMYLENRYDK